MCLGMIPSARAGFRPRTGQLCPTRQTPSRFLPDRVQTAAYSSARRLSVAAFSFFFDYPHRPEFICRDLIQGNAHAGLESVFELKRPLKQQAWLGVFRRIEAIQRTVVTAAAIVGSVWAEARVAEFFAAERPMNQEPQGGALWPLPRR